MKIAFVSDAHLITACFASRSMCPQQLDTYSEKSARELYDRMHREIERAFDACLNWVDANGPWDAVIALGDMVSGWQEQGCSHSKVKELALQMKNRLSSVCPVVRFLLGNHEIGYRTPVSMPGGGANQASVTACLDVFGEPFWSKEIGGRLIVGVCSSFASYSGRESAILKLQKDQKEFVGDSLSSWSGEWMLCTHSPMSPFFLFQQIRPCLEGLFGVACGEFHDPWKWAMVKAGVRICKPFSGIVPARHRILLACLQKTHLCPSVAPLWWQGYGALAVSGDPPLFQEVKINRPPETEKIPTSSRLNLWWARQFRKYLPW